MTGKWLRWSRFLRQAVRVDLLTQRMILHEDTQTVYSWVQGQGLRWRRSGATGRLRSWQPTRTAPDPDCGVEARDNWEAGQSVRRQGDRGSSQPRRRGYETSRQDWSACCGAGFFGQWLRSLSLDRRKAMIEPDHPRLSIVLRDTKSIRICFGIWSSIGQTMCGAPTWPASRWARPPLLGCDQGLGQPWRLSNTMDADFCVAAGPLARVFWVIGAAARQANRINDRSEL